MFAHLAVTDGELLANLKVTRIYNGLVVQCAEQELTFLVAVMDAHPHPFTREVRILRGKFNFHVIAFIVLGHVSPSAIVNHVGSRNQIGNRSR